MLAGCVAIMFPQSMVETTVQRRSKVTLTGIRVTIRSQELVSRIRSSRNGPDGVSGIVGMQPYKGKK